MNVKKVLPRLTALCLLCVLLLTSCGGGDGAGRTQTLASAGPSATPPTATLAPSPTPTPDPDATPEPSDDPQTSTVPDNYVPWGPNQVVEHIFFHPVIAYPKWAFVDCGSSTSQKKGLDDWMVTVEEYNKILQNLYEKNYIIVNMNDVWSEYTDADGNQRMQRNTLMLPPGKKPLIISFDDVNYYPYMLEQGFTSKLVVGEDGDIWAECTDPYTGETFLTQDLDSTTILDKFVKEHPDFSLNGAKGCLCLTGYYGILGYRTQTDRTLSESEQPAWEIARQKERELVKPIIQRLKETGWYFGSHTWGHISLESKTLEGVKDDTQRWFDEVGSLVGETKLLFYPHGARPDGGDDVTQTGPIFQYLQEQGFRVFSSVGIESYSKIKKDICAVICDRLHPDGTTLRWGRKRYLQFYDAKDIMDTQNRPDLGYNWAD